MSAGRHDAGRRRFLTGIAGGAGAAALFAGARPAAAFTVEPASGAAGAVLDGVLAEQRRHLAFRAEVRAAMVAQGATPDHIEQALALMDCPLCGARLDGASISALPAGERAVDGDPDAPAQG